MLRMLARPPVFERVSRSDLLDAEVESLRWLYDSPWGWAARLRDDALWPEPERMGEHTSEAWLLRSTDVPDSVVRKELKRRHRPGNATLYLVGRIEDPLEAMVMVREHFDGWKATEPEAVPPLEVGLPETGARVHHLRHDSVQTEVHLACRLQEAEHPEAADVLVDYLDLALFQELRAGHGATYSPGAALRRYASGVALLELEAEVEHGAAGSTAASLLALVNQLAQEGPEPARLEASRQRVARRTGLSLLTTQQVLAALVRSDWSGAGRHSLEGRGQRLASLRSQDLQQLALSCTEHQVMTVVGPKQVSQRLDEAGVEHEGVAWRAQVRALLETHDPDWLRRREEH